MDLKITPLFYHSGERAKVAIFMSGNGSNAEKLLDSCHVKSSFEPVVIVTDRPETSRADEIAEKYDLPLVSLDIKQFYSDRGESRVSLQTSEGRKLREQWTDELRELLKPYDIDFGVLAGFIPLSNITSDFPCLNVHPGDLTYEKEGRRYLVGLHKVPVERAILENIGYMRSSVIIAQTYSGRGGEMDSGPILGVSAKVEMDYCGYSQKDFSAVAGKRPEKTPKGGYKDILTQIAGVNLEQLKCEGDWVVFPPVVELFAAGAYGIDDAGKLYFKSDIGWQQVVTLEFAVGKAPKVMT